MELMIVVAIVVILLGVSFLALLHHQKNVKQLELDTVAKEIFVAAQNHLTAAASQGLTEQLAAGGAGRYGTPAGKTGEYYVVVGNGWESGDSEGILGLMLPFASVDETVRTGGSYVIHYNKDGNQILNVFYAQPKGDRFAYTLSGSDYSKLKDLTGASKKKARRSYNDGKSIVGWYGAEGGGALAVGAALQQPKVTVSNAEQLTVTVDDTVNASNADNAIRILELIVEGETSGALREIFLKHPDASKMASNSHWGIKNDGNKYTLVFDDVTVSKKHFNDLFNDTPDGKFIPGENLIIYARTSYSEKTGMATGAKKKTNSLFATGRVSGSNYQVTIANFRHLENLSEDISSYASLKGSKSGQKTTAAIQARDLSWKSFRKVMAKIKGTGTDEKTIHVYNKSDGRTPNGTYASLVVTGYTLEYSGHGKKITDVVIDETGDHEGTARDSSGLIGEMKGGTLSMVRLRNFSVASNGSAGALAGSLDGTKVTECVAYNSKKAERKEIKVWNAAGTDLSSLNKLEVSGKGNVGGLIGVIGGSGAKVEKSAAALYVKSTTTAGGLIGKVDGSVSIQYSYAGGHTKDGAYITSTGDDSHTYTPSATETVDTKGVQGRVNVNAGPTGTAGGLIGSGKSAALDKCYTTCSVFGKAGADTANNLIGDKNVTKIDGCYGAGVVYKEETAADSTKFLSVAGEKSDDTLELEKTPAAPAFPYDPLLFSSYKGRYGYKSMQQLASLTATESTALPDFMMSHYGDWAAPAVKAQLEVINEEVLHARIKIPAGKDTIETPMDIKLTVSVGAVGDTDPEKRKVFTVRTSSDTDVNGTALSNTEKIDPYKLGNVHRYDDGAFVYYDVVLDDITEAGTRFASLFKYLDDAAPTAEKKKTKPNIFYPGVEITEVIADIGGGTTVLSTQDDEFQDLEGRAKENRKWNSLYANGSLKDGESGVAGIENFRHLENLDRRISARDGKNEDNAEYTKLGITKAKQKWNLTWRKANPGGEEDGADGFQEGLLAIKRNWVVKHAAAKENPCPAMDPDATKAAAKAAAITNGKFSVYADGLKDPSGSEATVTGIQPYGEINGEKFNSYMPVNWSLKDDGAFTYDADEKSISNLYVRSPLKESIPSIPDSYQTDQYLGTIEKNPDTYKADAGLFGYVTTSNASGKTFKVQNLTMKNAEVLHGSSCGSVIGRVNTIASKDPGSTAADAAGTVLLDKIHVDGDYTHIVGIMLLNSSKKMVYARGYAGGLIGSAGDADIQIQDSHIKGKYAFVHSDALDSYGGTFAKSQTNLGGGCSGGLIASMQWCRMKIANCFCSAYVYGEYGDCNAGIIGRTYGNYKYSGGENSYVKNCYVAGRTRNATFQQGAFNWDQKAEVASTITGYHTTGGLIGYCSVLGGFDVRDCFSMASLFSTNEDVEEGKGSLGGLIGKINGNIRLSGCYAGGRIYAPDKYVGEQKGAAGTFIGVSTSSMNNIQGNMVLGGINYRVTRMIGTAPDNYDPTDTTKIKTVFVSDDSANDIQVASGSRIAAERYDQTLPESYPFLPLGQSKYCGDWEKPNAQDASYELKWTVENKDKLTASFDIPQERINDRCWITLLVKGKTSNKKCLAPIWIRYKDGTVTASVEKPKSVIDGFDDTQADLGTIKAGTGSFKSEEKDGKVTVTFVMDDITKESCHFAQHFPSLYQGENIAIYSVAGLKDLTKDGALNDVKEYASGSDSDGDGVDKRTLTNDVDKVGKIDTNSLFGNSTTVSGDDEDGSGNVAIIRWTRHLQNLDPLVSGINHVGSSGTGKGLAFAKAVQKKDIYWKDDDKSFRHNVGADKTITPFSTTYNTVKLPDAEYFYGIRNERLTEYDGDNNRLLKFTMKGGSENNISNFVKNDSPESGGDNKSYYDKANMAGLFRAATTDLTIKNLKVENFDCQASESVNYSSAGTIIGQAGEANNKSKHDMTLQLKDITVNGTKVYATKYHAGGLIGSIDNNKNSVKTRDITISDITYAGTIDVKTDTANENNAGGLTGYVQDADLKVTNVKSDGTLKVESKKFAGGLVGLMEGKQQFKADGVNISGTYEVKSTAYATGGVAGRIQGVSTIDVDNVNLKGFNGSAKTNIGSLFGVISGTATATTATNATMDNVEVDGLTMNTVDKSAGGVIGSTEGSFASLKAKTITVKGSGTIRSTEDAGGFAGHLAGMSGDNAQTNETVIEGFTLNLNAQDGTSNYQIRSDAGSAGGVIGTVGKRDGNVNNQQRINVFKVIKPKLTSPSIYGKKFAGGLIGVFNGNTNREAEISLDGQSDATNISDLVVEADTEDAGGLIAKIDTYYTRLAINKIHIDKLLRIKSNAKSAGGFIADLCTNKQGDSCGAAITDCNIEAAEDMDKGIVLATQEDGEVQYKAAGGILGRVQPNSDLQMNRVRVVNAKVMGMKRTGGILGNLDNNFRTFNAGNVRFYGRNACVCSKKLQVGGFAGYIGNGGTVNIKISCASAYVMTTGSHTGGFIGDLLAKGEITESYAGGHTFLDGNNAVYREGPALNYTPGVGVAFNKDAQDQEMRGGYNVYNASQNGGGNLGGFIGSVTGAVTFKKCFATTSVFSALAQKPGSTQKIGGLCGNIYSGSTVPCKFEDCYAAGKVFDVAASVTGNANIAPFCAEKNKNGGDNKSVRSYYLSSILTDAMYARLDAPAEQERFYFRAAKLSYEKLSGATDDSPFKNSEALGATANRFDGATVPNNQYAFPFYPTGAETRTFHGDWAAAIPPVTNSLQTMQHMAPMTAPLAAPGEPAPAAGDNTAPGGDQPAAGDSAPDGGQPSSEGGEPAPAAVPEAAPEPVP